MTVGCDACSSAGYIKEAQGEVAAVAPCECYERCTDCGGTRVIRREVGGYDELIPCECASLGIRMTLYNRAQIPARYRDKEIGAYVAKDQAHYINHGGNQGEVKSRLADYLLEFSPGREDQTGLLLTGRPGTGKTHLICAILGYLTLEMGIACRYVDFFHLIERLKGTFDKKASWQERETTDTQDSIIEQLVDIPVLAIDELGKGKGHATPWELSIVDQLISRRYNAGRIVLATSNYRPAPVDPHAKLRDQDDSVALAGTLDEKVGPRIVSRLRETCEFLHIQGPDFRGR